ncbi:LytTR family transcriptional regulator [Sphingomonas lutea]|uniref:LytTR family transcriptional regulator n=2 Tax=Sphingomonas lutea TaxID=1045317 RepID=A0A7G9SLB9_9SPHN|nr:LytTR family transcriptional regulator [Sphingomonas lutea]
MNPREIWRRVSLDIALFVFLGLVMAQLGPYRTLEAPPLFRTAYWLLAVFGAGLAAIVAERAIAGRVRRFWPRIAAASLLVTPPVTLYIYALNAVMLDLPRRWWLMPQLAWQVLVVMLLLMTLRALLWRRLVETRTIVMPPLPEAEREFRLRLSAKRRAARLLAIEAEDHYVRVHTDTGSELVTMRFSDALEELGRAYGHRVHRSWWVVGDAIEDVRWTRTGGEVRLSGGIVAPVSRSYAPALKWAGWR